MSRVTDAHLKERTKCGCCIYQDDQKMVRHKEGIWMSGDKICILKVEECFIGNGCS